MFLLAAVLAASSPCEARLLDYASWTETPGQRWDFEQSFRGGGSVTLFGAEHLRDPAHPQFARIAAAFAAARPTLAFFEGPDRGTPENADEAIRAAGESGYLRRLARDAGIEARSLEPSPAAQLAALRPRFSDDRILLFFVLREAARMRDREGRTGPDLDAAVSALLARAAPLAAAAGLATSIHDLDSLTAAAYREWPGTDWRAMPGDWFSPVARDPRAGFLTAINAADSGLRNAAMLSLFAEAARKGARVFVVVGRNHVAMLAPALACEGAH